MLVLTVQRNDKNLDGLLKIHSGLSDEIMLAEEVLLELLLPECNTQCGLIWLLTVVLS